MAEAFLTDGEDVRMAVRAHWKSGLMGMFLVVVLGGLGLWLGWWALDGFIWGGLLGLLIGAGIAIVASIARRTDVKLAKTPSPGRLMSLPPRVSSASSTTRS